MINSKASLFLREVKEVYTNRINLHISDPEQQLKVFDKNSVYLPTKKIGKNNPKAAEIEADNTARQEWNRTADMALLSGISEAKILEVKQTEIHEKSKPVNQEQRLAAQSVPWNCGKGKRLSAKPYPRKRYAAQAYA